MSTAETWVPGDPLMPDNGCGAMPSITMFPAERDAVVAEGGTPPPWWRPGTSHSAVYTATRRCEPCGVRWMGDGPCWMCGEECA